MSGLEHELVAQRLADSKRNRVHGLLLCVIVGGMLAIVFALSGCCSADPQKLAALDAEIATLTSLALADGARTPRQQTRIADAGDKARAHLQEIGK